MYPEIERNFFHLKISRYYPASGGTSPPAPPSLALPRARAFASAAFARASVPARSAIALVSWCALLLCGLAMCVRECFDCLTVLGLGLAAEEAAAAAAAEAAAEAAAACCCDRRHFQDGH